jgi:putative ubiquitin-RnfH superfamily antitoxin RatB of RatAB toxin-antitoxin module
MVRVELVWSPRAGEVRHRWLEIEPGITIESALRSCGDFMAEYSESLDALRIGIWGRVRPLQTVLRERDRIEVYRPLTVDPKEARRQRYAKRGERIVSRHRPKAGA